MTVEVYFTPFTLTPDTVAGRTVAVVDILRASTVSAVALFHGASCLYPIDTLENAEKLADRLSGVNPLLCGEREGHKIPGYDLGNSPLEYIPEVVHDRTLIHCSTNGTGAMLATEGGAHRFMAGLVNARAVTEEIAKSGLDLVLVCAGKEGIFALEDAFGAGRIISLLTEYFPEVALGNDDAATAEYLYQKNADDPVALLHDCPHGKYLVSLGFGQDLEICGQYDTFPIVPRMIGETVVSHL